MTKSHVENIDTGERKYTVVHGGTMDGTNCRSPMGCGMNREGAIEQTWQSNRAVRMENIGQNDVVDQLLITLFCRGHCLLVGVPGLAKTLLVSTIAPWLVVAVPEVTAPPPL